MPKLPVVFIAGPFRADTAYGVERNCQRAEYWALKVWALGAVAYCPHNNTRHFDGELSDDVWLPGNREMLSRSDAVFVVPFRELGKRSLGTEAECDLAQELGIPVFTETIPALEEWIKRFVAAHEGGENDG